ncbi:MAG TPA: GNAT family N-acetyltransferase, partial [Puia sp.]
SNNGFFGVVINERTGAIVGTFGLAAINQSLCELRKMYLSKKFRGGGIGKFILLTAIDISKQLHYHKIILETVTPLKEAIALYRQSGFIEITPHTINARVDKAFELDISK